MWTCLEKTAETIKVFQWTHLNKDKEMGVKEVT